MTIYFAKHDYNARCNVCRKKIMKGDAYVSLWPEDGYRHVDCENPNLEKKPVIT